METLDLKLFRKRVIETVSWCTLALEAAPTNKASPDLLRVAVPKPEKELLHFTHQALVEFSDKVFFERSRLSTSAHIINLEKVISRYNEGRLLTFSRYYNMNDGTVESESNGYFDYGGYPPWDTWVYYVATQDPLNTSHLITWVPNLFVEVADSAMQFSPDESLVWLDDYTDIKYKAILSGLNL